MELVAFRLAFRKASRLEARPRLCPIQISLSFVLWFAATVFSPKDTKYRLICCEIPLVCRGSCCQSLQIYLSCETFVLHLIRESETAQPDPQSISCSVHDFHVGKGCCSLRPHIFERFHQQGLGSPISFEYGEHFALQSCFAAKMQKKGWSTWALGRELLEMPWQKCCQVLDVHQKFFVSGFEMLYRSLPRWYLRCPHLGGEVVANLRRHASNDALPMRLRRFVWFFAFLLYDKMNLGITRGGLTPGVTSSHSGIELANCPFKIVSAPRKRTDVSEDLKISLQKLIADFPLGSLEPIPITGRVGFGLLAIECRSAIGWNGAADLWRNSFCGRRWVRLMAQ